MRKRFFLSIFIIAFLCSSCKAQDNSPSWFLTRYYPNLEPVTGFVEYRYLEREGWSSYTYQAYENEQESQRITVERIDGGYSISHGDSFGTTSYEIPCNNSGGGGSPDDYQAFKGESHWPISNQLVRYYGAYTFKTENQIDSIDYMMDSAPFVDVTVQTYPDYQRISEHSLDFIYQDNKLISQHLTLPSGEEQYCEYEYNSDGSLLSSKSYTVDHNILLEYQTYHWNEDVLTVSQYSSEDILLGYTIVQYDQLGRISIEQAFDPSGTMRFVVQYNYSI